MNDFKIIYFDIHNSLFDILRFNFVLAEMIIKALFCYQLSAMSYFTSYMRLLLVSKRRVKGSTTSPPVDRSTRPTPAFLSRSHRLASCSFL